MTSELSTAIIPTADLCVCYGTSRWRPPTILLQKLRLDQQNKCHYAFPGCSGKVTVVAHLCHNPPCRNVKHLVGSCAYCNRSISNLARRQRSRSVKDSVCVQNSDGDAETSMEKNLRTEAAWVEYVTDRLRHLGPGVGYPKHALTGDSAYTIGINVATVDRHWKKYASDVGPFLIYRPNRGTRLLVRLREQP